MLDLGVSLLAILGTLRKVASLGWMMEGKGVKATGALVVCRRPRNAGQDRAEDALLPLLI